MPSLNFMDRFAGMVERGEKTQAIVHKRPIKVGDTLQLYTGQRSKACRKLGEARCTWVAPVVICYKPAVVEVGGRIYSYRESARFMRRDGFSSVEEFMAFFADCYGLPFDGVLIEWELEAQGNG